MEDRENSKESCEVVTTPKALDASSSQEKCEESPTDPCNTSCAKLELQLFDDKEDHSNLKSSQDVLNHGQIGKNFRSVKKPQDLIDPPIGTTTDPAENNFILEQKHASKLTNKTPEEDARLASSSAVKVLNIDPNVPMTTSSETSRLSSHSSVVPRKQSAKEKIVNFTPIMNDMNYDVLFDKSKNDQHIIETIRGEQKM